MFTRISDHRTSERSIRPLGATASIVVGLALLVGAATDGARPSGMSGIRRAGPRPAAQQILYKPIEEIQVGEKVWAYDTHSGQWSAREVVRPLAHDYEGDLIAIHVSGQVIEATGNHPFWVVQGRDLNSRAAAEHVSVEEQELAWMSGKGRWVSARHLQPGDLLLLRSGELATVEELAARWIAQRVYNLEVAGLHTYAVSARGVLVHNACAAPRPGGGPPIYRQGKFGESNIKGPQWATENPACTPNYAKKYGLPKENSGPPDWVVGGRSPRGGKTRPAPPSHNAPENPGGGTEFIPRDPDQVILEWFVMP